MKARTIYQLDVPPEIFSFAVIGISSHENDYRLSWSLNEYLGLKFVQAEKFVARSGKEFSRFICQDEDQTLWIISNRCDNGFLLNKYKNFDFILKFEKELTDTELDHWVQHLKKAPLVSAVFPIPVNRQILKELT
ncbi:MAG: IPExxxVDY family protein [Bacteroidales bacterium]|jgi:hypothetical protein|nr:IPExxxVDY family protein [Bacteroidales bacterium]